jgi:hypothetical protein
MHLQGSSSRPAAMSETDQFFTLAIVGTPVSLLMGPRRAVPAHGTPGIEVHHDSGLSKLGERWRDAALLGSDTAKPGRPQRRPGRLRRIAERHALVIAGFGTSALAAAGLILGVRL